MRVLLLFCFLLLSGLSSNAQLQSPSDFLPHTLGDQFTPHHLLVAYMQHVAKQSPYVELIEYGRTNQDRPLLLAFIGTGENLNRLEAIRENNLKRTGIIPGETDPELNDILVLWLSFGVHGNEAAGPESAMNALYQLLTHPERDTWLSNTVICYDPTLNPDGYDRYTHWYRNVGNAEPDVDPKSREHQEPWPGGRVNHYLFDLNRDWAWQTQVESQQRMVHYNRWIPQVHVDVHEQGYNSPYYFAPAARPYHAYITDWQAEFQVAIGKNHAKYFDRNGWLYFTKERFDLLYPSYGDTYPVYNGAIGMTYEQGGIGAGRAILLENGDTLTLHDRIAHHTTTILSTIEICSQRADQLIEAFTNYWRVHREQPPGTYKTFVISRDQNSPGRLRAFCRILDRNGIQYGRAGQSATLMAFNYQTGESESLNVREDDLVISAHQPRAVLTQVLLEPKTYLEDSTTYDITAWSLPYAYGLEAWASETRLDPQTPYTISEDDSVALVAGAYAYALPWDDLSDARFLAQALQKGIKVRYAQEAFSVDGHDFPMGTLVITQADNRKRRGFEAELTQLVQANGQSLHSLTTGFTESGPDLGSGSYRFVERPNALLLGGEGVGTNSFGQVWHYFEQDIGLPLTVSDAADLGRINLLDYNTLILVDGRYSFTEDILSSINDWVRNGGHLMVIGSANRSLLGRNGFVLQRPEPSEEVRDTDTVRYSGLRREYMSNLIPGAIFRVNMDATHPLAYGIGDRYFSLKTEATAYLPAAEAWNVGQISSSSPVAGFAGERARAAQQGSAVFIVQDKGGGTITYLVDNPLFRSFWNHGKFLFSNALFLVNN